MPHRRESNSWIERWRHWAVWMDFELAAEILGSSEQSAGLCLPRLEKESQRRSALDGHNGKRPGEVNDPPLHY